MKDLNPTKITIIVRILSYLHYSDPHLYSWNIGGRVIKIKQTNIFI